MKKLFLILSITPSLALHGSSRDLTSLRADLDEAIKAIKALQENQQTLDTALKTSSEHWHTELKKINSKTNDAFQAVEARFAALDRQELLASPAESATATPRLKQDDENSIDHQIEQLKSSQAALQEAVRRLRNCCIASCVVLTAGATYHMGCVEKCNPRNLFKK